VRRKVLIVNAHGLHLRPATKFVKLANSFRSEVRVNGPGVSANGKSILDMTGLAAECGTELELEANGPDAEEALDALAGLVSAGFHMTDEDYRRP
jgi:phosphocarrier protein